MLKSSSANHNKPYLGKTKIIIDQNKSERYFSPMKVRGIRAAFKPGYILLVLVVASL